MAKRKATRKAAGSQPKAKKATTNSSTVANDNISKKTTSPIVIDKESIIKLAKRIITAHESEDTPFLDTCDDTGTIERNLWPYFLQINDVDKSSEEIAYALTLLTNRRTTAKGGGESQLNFVVEDYDDSSNRSATSPVQRTAA